jgi:hypothetical protein
MHSGWHEILARPRELTSIVAVYENACMILGSHGHRNEYNEAERDYSCQPIAEKHTRAGNRPRFRYHPVL